MKFLHEFHTEISEFPGWGLEDGLQFCHIGFKNKGGVIIPIFKPRLHYAQFLVRHG